MVYRRTKSLMLVAMLLMSVSTPNRLDAGYHHRNECNPATVLTIAGLAALGAACLYGIISWFSPSDRQIADQTEQDLREAQRVYTSIIEALEAEYAANNYRPGFSEQFLEVIAMRYFSAGQDYPEYLQEGVVRSRSALLRDAQDRLQKRLERLNAQDINTVAMRERMHYLNKELAIFIRRLAMIADFFKDHAGYFKLFQAETRIVMQYGDALQAMQMYAGSPADLTPILRVYVARDGTAEYPYTSYVNRLDSAIESLSYQMARLPYNYVERITTARVLLLQAQQLRAYIVADTAYTQEQQHRERMQQEERRIALERDRNRILQQQAYAQEEQARAQQRQARAQEEQNRLQRERDRDNQVIVVVQ